ncbi:MAG: hypothetical protein QM754_20790 [Tepidisphaeraceae bacterium]
MNVSTMNPIDRTERKRQMGWLREPAAARYQDGMNLYEYVRSDPVSLRDPSGLAATTQPSTQPGGIHLPGGPGPATSGSTTINIPGVGQVTLYGRNNNVWHSGVSAEFVAKVTKGMGCSCKDLQWSQKVKITINNPNSLTQEQIDEIMLHEQLEHGMNDPFEGYVPDNGYTDPTTKYDPTDPFPLHPPGYKIPNRYAPPLYGQDWPDKNQPWNSGDSGFGDWPWTPNMRGKPYPRGANITKNFILKLYCDGKQVGPDIHWSVNGIVGSDQNSQVDINPQ